MSSIESNGRGREVDCSKQATKRSRIKKGQAFDVKRVGREPGVRYVLEGSVRRPGGRVRITAQLIDGLSGAPLRADRFDGSLEDIFER